MPPNTKKVHRTVHVQRFSTPQGLAPALEQEEKHVPTPSRVRVGSRDKSANRKDMVEKEGERWKAREVNKEGMKKGRKEERTSAKTRLHFLTSSTSLNKQYTIYTDHFVRT